MKIAIMQPYFFPYLGYYQLFNAVDKFVLLDDVSFIMRGYINRNSILINGKSHRFTIPLEKPSQNKLINETQLRFPAEQKASFLKMIQISYKKAPYFADIFPLLEAAVKYDTSGSTLIHMFLKHSLEIVKNYLGIKAEILFSSELKKDNHLTGEARILEINRCLGASAYINPIGGQSLYNKEHFAVNGVELFFLKMKDVNYRQFKKDFVPNLSMIDVMMFNSKETTHDLFRQYELI